MLLVTDDNSNDQVSSCQHLRVCTTPPYVIVGSNDHLSQHSQEEETPTSRDSILTSENKNQSPLLSQPSISPLRLVQIPQPRDRCKSTTLKMNLRLEGIAISLTQVYQSAIQRCFIEGAGFGPSPVILRPGASDGSGLGLIRQMNPVQLQEEIIDCCVPNYFAYQVLNPKFYSYPVTFHLGQFHFEEHRPAAANGKSVVDVIWQEYIPMRFSMDAAHLFTRFIVNLYLNALRKYCECDKFSIRWMKGNE